VWVVVGRCGSMNETRLTLRLDPPDPCFADTQDSPLDSREQEEPLVITGAIGPRSNADSFVLVQYQYSSLSRVFWFSPANIVNTIGVHNAFPPSLSVLPKRPV
jgi:hypothetical protein